MSGSFAGIDVGGSWIKVLAFDHDGRSIAEESVPSGDDGTDTWRERVRTAVRGVVARCPTPVRLGLAAPGLPSANGSCIWSMPGRLAGLEGLNWQKWLDSDTPLRVLNDAQAALLGEVWLGAAKGASNVVMLTLGTGVGGAAMVDGHVLRGHLGRAGHLGHVPLNPDGPLDIVKTPGSLEDAIGEHNLALRSGGLFITTINLVEAYRSGSAEAAAIWLRSVRALAAAIAGFINVLDPERIVIGGGIADADDALFGPLQNFLEEFEWRPGGKSVRIVKAALGHNAGATGAAYAAKLATES